MEFKFKGLMAPVFTPFKDTDTYDIDLAILPEYADLLKRNNIMGILVNGTTGEGVSMTVEERKSVLEAWLSVARTRCITVLAQIGGAPLSSVTYLAKHAECLGVDGLLCLPDLFFKPRTEDELVEYLSLVGRAAPKTPLFYYHIPSFTQVNLDMGVFLEKAHGKIPTLAGVKYTHTDLEQGTRCVQAWNNTYNIFLGADQVTAGACVLGFDSAISTTLNMFPQFSHGIMESVKRGDNSTALLLQHQLNINIQTITSLGSWVGSMKAAMAVVTGLDMGPPRPPLTPLNQQQIATLKHNLTPTAGFILV